MCDKDTSAASEDDVMAEVDEDELAILLVVGVLVLSVRDGFHTAQMIQKRNSHF